MSKIFSNQIEVQKTTIKETVDKKLQIGSHRQCCAVYTDKDSRIPVWQNISYEWNVPEQNC